MSSSPRHLTLIASARPAQHEHAKDDPLWRKLRQEAEDAYDRAPALAALLRGAVLDRHSFEDAIIHRVTGRLANEIVTAAQIADAFNHALAASPEIAESFRADIMAVIDRDPACDRFIEPF